MTKRWIYALIVASIIVVGAIAGPVLAASQGTGGVSAPADNQGTAAGTAPNAGISGATSGLSYPNSATPPNFAWTAYTYGTDSTATTIYTVPSGYRLQIDDIWISFRGSTGYSENYIYRGPSSASAFLMSLQLGPKDHAEIAAKNVILNSGESIRIRSFYSGTSITYWTITGHWV